MFDIKLNNSHTTTGYFHVTVEANYVILFITRSVALQYNMTLDVNNSMFITRAVIEVLSSSILNMTLSTMLTLHNVHNKNCDQTAQYISDQPIDQTAGNEKLNCCTVVNWNGSTFYNIDVTHPLDKGMYVTVFLIIKTSFHF